MSKKEKEKQSEEVAQWSIFKSNLLSTAMDRLILEFMFAGINMFWALLRLILAPAVRQGLK